MDITNSIHFITEKDIRGTFYKKLLEFSLVHCDSFKLTVHLENKIDVREEGKFIEVIKDPRKTILEPYNITNLKLFIDDEDVVPNTVQYGIDCIYKLNVLSVSALLNCSEGLFDWGLEFDYGFFENLTLIDKSGSYWLESVPHEFLNIWNVPQKVLKNLISTLNIKDDIHIID